VAVFLALVLVPGVARGEHAKITLDVSTSTAKQTAHVDQTPPDSGKNPRPVLKVNAGESIKVQYMLTNVYPHKTLENMVVHFYIARQERIGQKELPVIDDDVVLETAFDIDMKPGAKAGQRNILRIDKPGVYLIRVETKQTKSDHEHFAAIDLVVSREKP
jgi:hypothetical protein